MTTKESKDNGKVKIIYVLVALLQAITMFGITASYSEFSSIKKNDVEQTSKIAVLESKLSGIENSLKEIKLDVHELVNRNK